MSDYTALVDPAKIREAAEVAGNTTLRTAENTLETVTEDLKQFDQYWKGVPANFYGEKLASEVNGFMDAFAEYSLYVRELLEYADRYENAAANASYIAEEVETEVASLVQDMVEKAEWASV